MGNDVECNSYALLEVGQSFLMFCNSAIPAQLAFRMKTWNAMHSCIVSFNAFAEAELPLQMFITSIIAYFPYMDSSVEAAS